MAPRSRRPDARRTSTEHQSASRGTVSRAMLRRLVSRSSDRGAPRRPGHEALPIALQAPSETSSSTSSSSGSPPRPRSARRSALTHRSPSTRPPGGPLRRSGAPSRRARPSARAGSRAARRAARSATGGRACRPPPCCSTASGRRSREEVPAAVPRVRRPTSAKLHRVHPAFVASGPMSSQEQGAAACQGIAASASGAQLVEVVPPVADTSQGSAERVARAVSAVRRYRRASARPLAGPPPRPAARTPCPRGSARRAVPAGRRAERPRAAGGRSRGAGGAPDPTATRRRPRPARPAAGSG